MVSPTCPVVRESGQQDKEVGQSYLPCCKRVVSRTRKLVSPTCPVVRESGQQDKEVVSPTCPVVRESGQ